VSAPQIRSRRFNAMRLFVRVCRNGMRISRMLAPWYQTETTAMPHKAFPVSSGNGNVNCARTYALSFSWHVHVHDSLARFSSIRNRSHGLCPGSKSLRNKIQNCSKFHIAIVQYSTFFHLNWCDCSNLIYIVMISHLLRSKNI